MRPKFSNTRFEAMRRQEQSSVSHQAMVVEGDLDAIGVIAW